MRAVFGILALGALSACGGSGGSGIIPASVSPPPGPTAPAPSAPPSAPSSVDTATFGNLLNNVRLANSAAAVTYDSRLANAAQGHADDMLAQNYFSHTGRNGSSPGDRITAAGYNWSTYGENIAQGQTSESEVMDAWTNSPGHHANNINPNFEDFGIAKAGSGSDTRWVLLLATEQ